MNLGALATRLAKLEARTPKGDIPTTMIILSEGHNPNWDNDSIHCRIEAGDPRQNDSDCFMTFMVEEGDGPGSEIITYRDSDGVLFEIGQCEETVPKNEYITLSPMGDQSEKFEVPPPRVSVTKVEESTTSSCKPRPATRALPDRDNAPDSPCRPLNGASVADTGDTSSVYTSSDSHLETVGRTPRGNLRYGKINS